MSNVIRIFEVERADRTVTAPVEVGTDGLKSLFESWSSITASLEELRDHLDDLSSVLQVLSDGVEKSYVGVLMNEAEIRIRDSLTRSIGVTAVVARMRRAARLGDAERSHASPDR